MQIKDLISQLQSLYNTYDDEYKAIAGEPEIMIDAFSFIDKHFWTYAGISPRIVIEKTTDGVYDVLSTVYEDQDPNQEAPKRASNTWPFPEGGEASFDGPQAKA